MAWQDTIITLSIIAFSYALIPQITKGFKLKKPLVSFQTALITSLGMFVLAATYFTLGLFFSTIMAFITGGMWSILLIQSKIYR